MTLAALPSHAPNAFRSAARTTHSTDRPALGRFVVAVTDPTVVETRVDNRIFARGPISSPSVVGDADSIKPRKKRRTSLPSSISSAGQTRTPQESAETNGGLPRRSPRKSRRSVSAAVIVSDVDDDGDEDFAGGDDADDDDDDDFA
jgi:hypothetical protein